MELSNLQRSQELEPAQLLRCHKIIRFSLSVFNLVRLNVHAVGSVYAFCVGVEVSTLSTLIKKPTVTKFLTPKTNGDLSSVTCLEIHSPASMLWSAFSVLSLSPSIQTNLI